MKKLNLPILMIVFNRPGNTRRVFEAVKNAKPTKLFVAADGPRINNPADAEKCQETRDIFSQIDWDCEIKTLFQDHNLGCKYGPITAIDWFFSQVPEGIILEDDCLPDPTFFDYCQELLEKYRDNSRIMHISGNNFQGGVKRGNASYYFSNYTHNWGWATWRRAWSQFHKAIKTQPSQKSFQAIGLSSSAKRFWSRNFIQTWKKNSNWDSLWMYTVWKNKGLSILPNENLVTNIGFSDEATHTKSENVAAFNPTKPINMIIHPDIIEADQEADELTFRVLFYRPLWKRVLHKLKEIFK